MLANEVQMIEVQPLPRKLHRYHAHLDRWPEQYVAGSVLSEILESDELHWVIEIGHPQSLPEKQHKEHYKPIRVWRESDYRMSPNNDGPISTYLTDLLV